MIFYIENAQAKKFKFLPGLAGLIAGKFLLMVSFGLMVLAPLWYWILRIPYINGKLKNKAWLKITPIVVWWITFALILSAGL